MNKTKIQWTDHTFNAWIGCTKVSSACKNCYAESIALNKGLVSKWGQGSPRRKTSTANWFTPRKWNEDAKRNQERPKVFCSSMADVFDNEVSPDWRRELFELIERTESLDWQILTKRPHLIEQQLTQIGYWEKLPLPNVWFGATMEDQSNFDKRWPHLRRFQRMFDSVPTSPPWVTSLCPRMRGTICTGLLRVEKLLCKGINPGPVGVSGSEASETNAKR